MGSILRYVLSWFPQIQELQDQIQTLHDQIQELQDQIQTLGDQNQQLQRDVALLQNAPARNAPVINALVINAPTGNAPARNAPTERPPTECQIQRDKMEEVRFWDFYWPGSICLRFRSYLTNL
jgi:peptidoglycan hydrolase CwlO-like protein